MQHTMDFLRISTIKEYLIYFIWNLSQGDLYGVREKGVYTIFPNEQVDLGKWYNIKLQETPGILWSM